MKIKTLYLILSAVLLGSCSRKISYETNYILKPLVQEMVSTPTKPQEGVVAYAYAVDTLQWGIASYDDALAGIITSKQTGEKRQTPDSYATPYTPDQPAPDPAPAARFLRGNARGDNPSEGGDPITPNPDYRGWLTMPLGGSPHMIVVADTAHKLYGYTMQEAVLNLPNLFVAVVFKPWHEGRAYGDGKWSFYNDFFEPPVELVTYISPKIQLEEGGAESDPAAGRVKAYAYLADTTEWRIASYDDAVAGRLTHKQDDQLHRDLPNFQAYAEDSGLYAMTVTGTPLMVVTVDRTNRLYAYTQQTPDLHGTPPTWSVLFRPWMHSSREKVGDWVYVNEFYQPAPKPQP